jgi:hypothetical protein
MTASEAIKYFEGVLKTHGDVELLSVEDDGRSSWVIPYSPCDKYTKQWPMRSHGWLVGG